MRERKRAVRRRHEEVRALPVDARVGVRLGDAVVVKLETQREAGETAAETAEGVDRREEERRAPVRRRILLVRGESDPYRVEREKSENCG